MGTPFLIILIRVSHRELTVAQNMRERVTV